MYQMKRFDMLALKLDLSMTFTSENMFYIFLLRSGWTEIELSKIRRRLRSIFLKLFIYVTLKLHNWIFYEALFKTAKTFEVVGNFWIRANVTVVAFLENFLAGFIKTEIGQKVLKNLRQSEEFSLHKI